MKLAVVIPWFGRELRGGAEQHAWNVAEKMAARGHAVDVLTTCCRSHQEDWETNHLPAGREALEEGFTVRRFPVVARNRAEFDRVNARLMSIKPHELRRGVSPVNEADAKIFVSELIKSPALLEFIAEHKESYDTFIFLPYLYGLVIDGVMLARERAALQPCLHDEAYAYLPAVEAAFRAAHSLLFISEGERRLALDLFGPGIWHKARFTGAGAEHAAGSAPGTAEREGSSSGRGRYLLYLGRKEEGKNVPMLLRAFSRFKAVRPNSDLRLLLAGHGRAELNGLAPAVEDLGLVSDAEKARLLKNCFALVQPSAKESYSRVMMEAWFEGKPVAVHRDCHATAVAVEQSYGGWSAGDEQQWAELLVRIDRTGSDKMAQLGENGRRYADVTANWDRVMERYEEALTATPREQTAETVQAFPDAAQINQFLPNLAYGDAISSHAIWIRNRLREFGFTSHIFARYIDPRIQHECHLFSPAALHHASDAAIYHHSIGSEITPHLLEFQGPKCVVYHNITPAEFFEPFWPDYAPVLRRGRQELPALAPHFPVAVGDSSYNVAELQEDGFHEPTVLPIAVDPAKWNFTAAPGMMDQLQDGRTNILFVGRIAPNKKQDDLVVAFREYLEFDPTARLILIGKAEENDVYAAHLGTVIEQLGVGDLVILPGSISDTELQACYRNAHLFWSMSEHEGFCVPLIEAMWFDVPVLAFRSSAVPETLGGAALMFREKADLRALAALAHVIVTDREVREKIIAAQRRQRQTFLPEKIVPLIADIANRLRDSLKEPPRTSGDVGHPDTAPEVFRLRTRSWPIIDSSGGSREINQCLPNLAVGDAVSTLAITIRESLRRLGYRSKILVTYRDHPLVHECEVVTAAAVQASQAVIYHHSIGDDITGYVRRFRGPKALIYHNITPAEFYDDYSPIGAARLRRGREELCEMAPDFPLALGVSRFNAAELSACGFKDPGVLPLCVDPARWDAPDRQTVAAVSDGRTNLLFVGRIAPNKKQDDLIRGFRAYLELDRGARLILIGGCEAGDAYAAYLDELVRSLGLEDSVLRPGFVSEAQLIASYQTAHLFWSMSEHEGFCVPLVEAMWFDVPVFAFASTAVPETLGGAGELFSDKSDMAAVAARAHQLVKDRGLRARIVQAQRKRRAELAPEKFIGALEQLATQLTESASSDDAKAEPRALEHLPKEVST